MEFEIRASFDIGSGSTKVQVSEVDREGRIRRTLLSQERPHAYGVDLVSSSNGNLSDSIMDGGLATLLDLKAAAVDLGAKRFAAVATEVFRKAKNGSAFLSRLKDSTGMPIALVTQELEGELGFVSVVASSGQDPMAAVVWDSGGASMQITSRCATTHALRAYLAPLGTSIALGTLIKDVQKRDMPLDVKLVGCINPVSAEDSQSCVEALMSKLPAGVPDWLFGKEVVSAAAGTNSLFKLCCDVLNAEGAAGIQHFTLPQAEAALGFCVGKSDEELKKYQSFEYAEGTHVLVPKLALLVAVMRVCGIKRVELALVTGSCPAVLTLDRFW